MSKASNLTKTAFWTRICRRIRFVTQKPQKNAIQTAVWHFVLNYQKDCRHGQNRPVKERRHVKTRPNGQRYSRGL